MTRIFSIRLITDPKLKPSECYPISATFVPILVIFIDFLLVLYKH